MLLLLCFILLHFFSVLGVLSKREILQICQVSDEKYCYWLLSPSPDAERAGHDYMNITNTNTNVTDVMCNDILDHRASHNQLMIKANVRSSVNQLNPKDIGYSKLMLNDPTANIVLSLAPMYPLIEEAPIIKNRVEMTDKALDKFCSVRHIMRPEFMPERGCQGMRQSYPALHAPWCGDWNATIVVTTTDCGIVEDGQSHKNTIWSIYSKFGIISAKDKNNYGKKNGSNFEINLRAKLDDNAQVYYLEEAAVVGYVEYPNAYGHFANEVLPRLLFLDKVLPLRTPLYWPNNFVSNEYYDLLKLKGLVSNRQVLLIDSNNNINKLNRVVKKLFFVTTTSSRGEGFGDPFCSWALQRLTYSTIQSMIPGDTQDKNIIGVLQRKQSSRSIKNHEDLISALSMKFPLYKVLLLEARTGQLLENLKLFSSTFILIAPHGAGLNNMYGLRPNSSVIEVGFTSGDFSWPSDYLCLARNLGLRYFSTFAVSGSYESSLEVDVEDIVDIVSSKILVK